MRFIELFFLTGTALALPATAKANDPKACDTQKVAQLAGGIQANLAIQAQELAGIQELQKLSSASGNNTNGTAQGNTAAFQFEAQRQTVIAIQQSGIAIREQNQVVAQQLNSPSQDGLAIVSKAQLTELVQVTSLTGQASQDSQVLATLVKEVQDGTNQNKKNLQAALGQCKQK